MRFDSIAIGEAQRRAYNSLTAREIVVHNPEKGDKTLKQRADGKWVIKNKHYCDPKLTSSPAMLIQEQAWVNSTQRFDFDFSINGPQQTPGTNNNITIDKNSVFAIYAVQFLFGTGTNSNAFIYRSHGVLPADDSVYNSEYQLKIESSTFITKMEGQFFRDNPQNSNEYFGEIGIQLINPIRIVSGELGVFQMSIILKNPINTLVLSTNTVLSMRLHGVYGQAKG